MKRKVIRKPRLVLAVTGPASADFLRGQLAYMRGKGFDVTLISSPGALPSEVARADGVRLFTVEMEREAAPWRDLKALGRIVRFMLRERPTIVNAGTPKASLLVLLAAWLTGVPCRVYSLRGLRLESSSGLARALLTLLERALAGMVDRVIFVGPLLRERAGELGLADPHKSITLANGSGNGVDGERFARTPAAIAAGSCLRSRMGIPADAPVLGFVARVVQPKGVAELVAAWEVLRQEFPALHLLVVGEFGKMERVAPEIERLLRGDPRVHLTDNHVPDVVPYYAAMDLLAHPSYREGFSNVVLEAAAMELPVIASRIPGCADAVADGISGTLIPPHDPPALVEAARRYLSDPELRRRHGSAGRRRVLRDFRPELIWQGQLELYRQLLREKGLVRPR